MDDWMSSLAGTDGGPVEFPWGFPIQLGKDDCIK